jgi:tRNA(Ile)-lysidine synthase TilS/MesJ
MSIKEDLTLKFQSTIADYDPFSDIESFVLLFSGGKDCSFLLSMLLNCYPVIAKNAEVICVTYPHHMYYNEVGDFSSFQNVKNYWTSKGIRVNYITPINDDFDDNCKLGCSICKSSRKAIIDPYLNKKDTSVGILTGLTLFDALAYFHLLLARTRFNLDNFENLPDNIKTFLIKTLHKLTIREVLPSKNVMLRPLLRFNEKEIKEYLTLEKIPYIDTPCKISNYKFKRSYSDAWENDIEFIPVYEDIVKTLAKHGIHLSSLPFDGMVEDSFFIDC